ncbi:MAG: hypothetical protein HGB10_04085 [Coriobacteriia bacterium]|nr:hypothetical protein [Coriobacteriia bacterium]
MSLTRTNSGLQNLHLFLKADVVVFIEGGTCVFTYDQVTAGQCSSVSADMVYWQRVFAHYLPTTRLSFRAVGSKPTLKTIADKISSFGLKHVFVAMDQDADRFSNSLITAPGVFYSWGYSWENDLLHACTLTEGVLGLCPIDRLTYEQPIAHQVRQALSDFYDEARWYIKADVALMAVTGEGLFHRGKWKKYLDYPENHSAAPRFNRAGLRQAFEDKRRRLGPRLPAVSNPQELDPKRYCFGHMLGTFQYRLLTHLVKRFSGSLGFSEDHANTHVAQALMTCWTQPDLASLRSHHDLQFGRL